ncbi:MAG: undecaprenyl-diphosphate phosphatase, partial [Rhodospirillales bacterium]|nr:undecaprenyl-diphosphate phosphatase [Rhodospirillales bacterium]
MTLFQIVVLAIIQGITEFMPISSSGHLALAPQIAGWPDQGLMIDVAVHVGTLGAVCAYLWRDMWAILRALPRLLAGKVEAGAKLLWLGVVGSVPVAGAGFAMHVYGIETLRTAEIIGWAFLGFGILLYLSDRLGLTVRRIEHMSVVNALYIGIAQTLALIPGASRAGVTITMARMLGFERREAARFSMLLSIPAILGAGLLQGLELIEGGNIRLQTDAILAAGLSFSFALIGIDMMMGWLRRASYTPFVIYRMLAGA